MQRVRWLRAKLHFGGEVKDKLVESGFWIFLVRWGDTSQNYRSTFVLSSTKLWC